MNRALTKEFRNPPSTCRGKPFWAWNGLLKPDELRRQIRIMKQMGFGGFFMHSRVGLETAYLSPEWFTCVDACIDEAKKLDMEAWLYDEDRWPSGAAGGLVTKNQQFRMRSLRMNHYTSPKNFSWSKATVAAFLVVLDQGIIYRSQRLTKGAVPKKLAPGETLITFALEIQGDSDWYNGQAYLDTMNPAAVKEFIRITHEAYRVRYGKDFGTRIPGIFSDEPFRGFVQTIREGKEGPETLLAWTDRLPTVFKQRYGYDILDHLPTLVYDSALCDHYQPRYHYHDCTTFMFIDAYSRQIGAWCEKNNLQFTGHLWEEQTLSSQVAVVGSAMRFYEYMQAPGIDILTEHVREYETAKQVSSMARQFGRKWRLTETYGCTGWDFPLAGHKAISDWQVALGINLRCQHLAWYTMLGEAKRDYPAGIFYQSPWWQHYSKVEDYYGRIHAVMTRGEEVRDILVIHPIESTWLLCNRFWKNSAEVNQLDKTIVELRDSLLMEHLDFDYGDEEIVARHGQILKGKQGAELTIKKGRYKAVIIPPQLTIRASTLALLKKFKSAGGLVVFAGEPPKFVDAVESSVAAEFAKECSGAPSKGAELAAIVAGTRRVSIIDSTTGNEIAPALYLLRQDNEAFYLFICNTSMTREQMKPEHHNHDMVRDRKESFADVTITVKSLCKGAPLELDPSSGHIFTADAEFANGGWAIKTSLPVLGSRLFVIPHHPVKQTYPHAPRYRTLDRKPVAQKQWPVTLSEDNCLVLDRAAYKIGSQPRKTAAEILRIDKKVRDCLGVRHRGGGMKQPWATENPVPVKSVPLELTYSFKCTVLPGGALFLALEKAPEFGIAINGTTIPTDVDSGWWVDRSLIKIPVDPLLIKPGNNIIVLKLDYKETFSGLEIIYLLGNFGTTVNDTAVAITAPVTALTIGDWVAQGLAFYSGSVAYAATVRYTPRAGEHLFIEVPEYCGTAVRVIVGGLQAGIIAWEPHELDITEFLTAGDNQLRIEVIGHRRNSHGPHHLQERWPVCSGPDEFQKTDKQWREGYGLVPCGLMAVPVLSRRQIAYRQS